MKPDQEKKTMNERIKAFYAQSGGPNNPQINQIIEKHLLDGKDHGVPGKRETFKDAVLDVFLDDFSTKDMVMWLLKTKYDLSDRWQELLNIGAFQQSAAAGEESAAQRIEQLENRISVMEDKLQAVLDLLQQGRKTNVS